MPLSEAARAIGSAYNPVAVPVPALTEEESRRLTKAIMNSTSAIPYGPDPEPLEVPEGGTKQTSGKAPMHLIDPGAELELARVLEFGAKKYAPENWRKGLKYTDVIAAIKRHTNAIHRGEYIDPETGRLHAAHLMCEAMFLTAFMLNPLKYFEFDDVPGHVGELPWKGAGVSED